MRKGEEMMKKELRRITALMLLICLGILLISCASQKPSTEVPEVIPPTAESDSTPSAPEEEEAEEERIPENQTVIYRAIAEEWSRYLTYKAPTVKSPLTATAVYTERAEEQILSSSGTFIFTREKIWDDEKKVENHILRVYNKTNGKQVIPALTKTDKPQSVSYQIQLLDAIVSVGTVTPVLDEMGQIKEYHYAYDAYSVDGVKLNEASYSEPFVKQEKRGDYYYATAGDTCYISRAGQILLTLPANVATDLPVFDRVFEDYGYVLGDSFVRIVGKDGKPCAEYELSKSFARSDVKFSILSDGDLFIRYQRTCSAEEELYTVKDDNGDKQLLSYVVLDAASGKATEIPVRFLLNRLVTNAEDDGLSLSVASKGQYAEIVYIENGKMQGSTVPVILDGELSVVKELPLILKNQVSLVRAANERFWILRLSAVNSQYPYTPVEYYYSVDISVGTVAMYADLNASAYTPVDGGFLYEDVLYNDMMIKQMDLSQAHSYEILGNGRILVETEQDEKTVRMLVYLENHQVKTAELGDGNDVITDLPDMENSFLVDVYDQSGKKTSVQLRDLNGKLILSGDSIWQIHLTDDLYVIGCLKDGKTVYYAVSGEKGIDNEK